MVQLHEKRSLLERVRGRAKRTAEDPPRRRIQGLLEGDEGFLELSVDTESP